MGVVLEEADSSLTKPGFLSEKRPEFENCRSVPRRSGHPLFFSRYRQDRPGLGLIEPTPLADRLMCSVELRPLGPTDLFRDGRHARRPSAAAGTLGLYDLRQSWAGDLRDPFDNLNIFLPFSSFRELAAERGQTFFELRYDAELVYHDEVILHLALAILPALKRPHEISQVYLDHAFLTIRDYLSETYGVFGGQSMPQRLGLSRKQLDMAVRYIEANLGKDISLSDIARASAASISSLTRGFKLGLGVSPHQWILNRRIALAQHLMRDTKESLGDVAVSCGFADQSHLSRVFMRRIGASPGAWRRSIRG